MSFSSSVLANAQYCVKKGKDILIFVALLTGYQ